MALGLGDFLHRTIVLGCFGFGVYGAVVIGQNVIVKRNQIKLALEQQRAEIERANAAARGPPPFDFETEPAPTSSI